MLWILSSTETSKAFKESAAVVTNNLGVDVENRDAIVEARGVFVLLKVLQTPGATVTIKGYVLSALHALLELDLAKRQLMEEIEGGLHAIVDELTTKLSSATSLEHAAGIPAPSESIFTVAHPQTGAQGFNSPHPLNAGSAFHTGLALMPGGRCSAVAILEPITGGVQQLSALLACLNLP